MPISNYSSFKKYKSSFHCLLDNDKKKRLENQGDRRQVLNRFLRSISSNSTSSDLSSYETATQNSFQGLKSEDDFLDFESETSSNVSIVTIEDEYESFNLFESPFDNPVDNPSICMENIDEVEDGSSRDSEKVSEQTNDLKADDNNDSDDCIILDDEPAQSGFKVKESEYRNHIKVGMNVMALKDKFRNMWHFGTIVRIEGRKKSCFIDDSFVIF